MLAIALLLVGFDYPVRMVVVTDENAAEVLPPGKEVDAIAGDVVLSNDYLTAVIAQPIAGRNANLTCREVGGCVIDLAGTTFNQKQPQGTDELTVYRPGRTQGGYRGWVWTNQPDAPLWQAFEDPPPSLSSSGYSVRVGLEDGEHAIYTLRMDAKHLEVTTTGGRTDEFRVDRSGDHFFQTPPGEADAAVTESPWWSAASQLTSQVDGQPARVDVSEQKRGLLVRHQPGATRLLTAGRSRLDFWDGPTVSTTIIGQNLETGTAGATMAKVTRPSERGPVTVAMLRTNGVTNHPLPVGPVSIIGELHGQSVFEDQRQVVRPGASETVQFRSAQVGLLRIRCEDESGFSVPTKVAIRPTDPNAPPLNFGPISAIDGVREVLYISEPRTIALPVGQYDLLASRGPEYDLTRQRISLGIGPRPQEVTLTLRRAFDTPGWISADFHSHSTPSGDNTSHQRGRVLNLVCEDIDFAPCTEHQRIDSYQSHIDALGLQPFLLSCSGMELTGRDLPINHHNVFPLVHKPLRQDGGGPRIGDDPDMQVERLALWDDRSEKLIQQNHPDIRRLLEDRDNDGTADEGYPRAVGLLDAIEIHPIELALQLFPDAPKPRQGLLKSWNADRIRRWLELVQTRPLAGVINTDAHWNHHGSGWARNWIAVDDDDPASADVLAIARATRAGRVVMSNGPMLTMAVREAAADDEQPVGIGQTLATAGRVVVDLEVRCADWVAIDRVGLLVGTEMVWVDMAESDSDLGEAAGAGFVALEDRTDGVAYRRSVSLDLPSLTDADRTTLVAACGHATATLGLAVGEEMGVQNPAALTNPVYLSIER